MNEQREDEELLTPPPADRLFAEIGTAANGTSGTSGEALSAPLPDRISRYIVERLLGSGAFGHVYLARDEELDRRVAVKAPRIERFSSDEDVELFLQEARTTAGLEHPRIVPVYDVGRTEGGTCYVVMQWIDGQSLADLSHTKPPTPPQAAELMAGVAEGVHFAHTHGIIHRDLKPSNILVDAQGRPRVADFGIALRESEQRRRAGEISGTPAYMAPEQIRGETHRLDGRCDVWSLGVILYELLAGRRPFSGSRPELLDEILHREPKPLRQINDQIPAELERICLKCLSKQVADRYSTAADLSEDLKHWRDAWIEAPTEIVSHSIHDQPSSGSRLPIGWVLGAVSAAALVVAIWWMSRDSAGPPANPPPLAAAPAMSGTAASAAALTGTVDIRVYRADAPGRWLSLHEEATRPLRPGDRLQVRVELSRPSYVYVAWIDADGVPAPVYPWTPGDWSARPAVENPIDRLRLPDDADQGWRNDGKEGMETIVLMARDAPLPDDVDLEQLLSGFPKQEMQDPRALVWLEGGAVVTGGDRAPQFFDPKRIDDPVLQSQRLIAERLKPHFDLIRAVSFANQGR